MTRSSGRSATELPVRCVTIPELLARLSHVQAAIRACDHRFAVPGVISDIVTDNPKLLSMFTQERRILEELNQRKNLLRKSIEWTVLGADGRSWTSLGELSSVVESSEGPLPASLTRCRASVVRTSG